MLGNWTILLIATVTFVVCAQARGPLCLKGTRVSSLPTTVEECWPWESCYATHHVDTEGDHHFDFGCRPTQECQTNTNSPHKRIDLKLCDKCCTGDICNVDICPNGTVPDRELPCLQCTSVVSVLSCDQLIYCNHGEVCFAQKSVGGPHPTFTMGCLRKDVCDFFEGQVIGKRADESVCHKCCESPGCNRDSCSPEETTTEPTVTTAPPPARDCWDLRHIYNRTADGTYSVQSPSGNDVDVRCDMTTDGGGWIVFQKRHRYLGVNFDRSYVDYKAGFGTLSDEFWMGNDRLHELTKNEKQRLRVDICDWGHAHRYAEYDFFMVGPGSDNFRLSVAVYTGTAGDALLTGTGVNEFHNNQQFSTPDVDHDISPLRHCAKEFHSGWWFADCFSANLNGVYNPSGFISAGRGLQWRPWIEDYSFMRTEMKFRPSHVQGEPAAFHC